MMPATGCCPSRILDNRKVLTVLRVAIAGIFIYASWEKIAHPDAFADIIDGYQILPAATLWLVAIWLPWTEMLAGLALLVGIWPRAIGLLFSGLTVVFIVGLIQAMARGIDIQCGCFSLDPAAATRSWASLWQEFLLLAGCLWLWIGHWKEPATAYEEEQTTG